MAVEVQRNDSWGEQGMSKLLRLEDVAGEYFGLSPAMAKRKAALNTFPIPAFRLADRGQRFADIHT